MSNNVLVIILGLHLWRVQVLRKLGKLGPWVKSPLLWSPAIHQGKSINLIPSYVCVHTCWDLPRKTKNDALYNISYKYYPAAICVWNHLAKLLITLWYTLLRPDVYLAHQHKLCRVNFMECWKVNQLIYKIKSYDLGHHLAISETRAGSPPTVFAKLIANEKAVFRDYYCKSSSAAVIEGTIPGS